MRCVTAPGDTVVTVGAGASTLVTELLHADLDVTAVDIAEAALDTLVDSIDRAEHFIASGRLRLVVADVRQLHLDTPVDVWHDRAVFHFLVDPADRSTYAERAADAVRLGGHLVIATFGPDGPESCSGLPVQRHDAASIADAFGPSFELVESFDAQHTTPWGSHQQFVHSLLRRV